MKPNSKFLNSIFEISHVEFQEYNLHKHRLVFSSGVTSKILGYTMAEYQKLSRSFYSELIHPDDRQKVQETIDKLIHSSPSEVVEMTVRALKSDGSYLWIYSRQMVLERDDKGNICTMIRETEDVTKLVELQDQLKERVQQLQTISYKNSHLLRSPVASIIGLVSLVEEQYITNEHNKLVLQYMKQAIEKLDEIVREINDLAQI